MTGTLTTKTIGSRKWYKVGLDVTMWDYMAKSVTTLLCGSINSHLGTERYYIIVGMENIIDLSTCSLDELLTIKQNAIEADNIVLYRKCNDAINALYSKWEEKLGV